MRIPRPIVLVIVFFVSIGTTPIPTPNHVAADEISVAKIDHPADVDFERELLPILRKKCLACHNETDAEGDFIAENPRAIVAGGASGAAVVPGMPGESLLMALAAHRDEPIMPPEENEAGAVPFTPDELALLQLWIEQGAKGEVSTTSAPIQWQTLAPSVNPVYAASHSRDGRYVAAGRANQIWVYDLALNRYACRLVDGALANEPEASTDGIAHLDLVQSIAFENNNRWIASGGYRTVKLWRQTRQERTAIELQCREVQEAAVLGNDIYVVCSDGRLQRFRDGQHTDLAQEGHVSHLAANPDASLLAVVVDKHTLRTLGKDGDVVCEHRLESGAAVTGLAFGEDYVGVARADHSIAIQKLDAKGVFTGDTVTLVGHTQPVTLMAPLSTGQLAAGSADGDILIWQLAAEPTSKRISHGTSLTQLEAYYDSEAKRTRLASVGGSAAKLWDLGKLEAIDVSTQSPGLNWQHAQARIAEQVAKRHVDNCNQDLKAAKQRVEEEEKNLEKTIAARDNAAKELKESQVAAETAKAEKIAADELVASEKQKLAAAEKLLADAADEDAKKAAQVALDAAKTVVEKAEAAAKTKSKADEEAKKKLTEKTQTAESTIRSVETSERAVKSAKLRVVEVEPTVKVATDRQQEAASLAKNAEEARSAFQHATTLVTFGGNGTFLVGIDKVGQLLIWDVANGKPIELISSGVTGAVCLGIEGDLSSPVVANAVTTDGQVYRVPLSATWELEKTIGDPNGDSPFSDRVTALGFRADGTHLAVGGGPPSRDGELHIVDVEQGKVIHQIENAHSDTVFGLAYSPDGRRIASCGADRFMKIFELESGKLVRTFEGHTHHVLSVSWRADGRALATGGADKLVKIWNSVDGSQLKTIQGFGKEVVSLQFAGTTDEFYAACGDHHLYRCNVGGERKSIGKGTDFLYTVSTSAAGESVTFAGQDSVVRVVDREGKLLAELAP